MQIQFHPASGRGAVRSFSLGERGQRAAIPLVATLLALAVSLWLTVPLVLARRLREGEAGRAARELERRKTEWARAVDLARSLRQRAFEAGNLLNRIAFLYAFPAERWPRILNPERHILSAAEPERVLEALDLYLRGLERARTLLADREREDSDLARRVPAVVPVAGSVFEPSAFFGPRTSPWTGEEEFSLGVDFAAPEGSPVVAAGAGVVAFAGTVRRAAASRFWRLGNLIVISHGASGVTVYGHLVRIRVRRGDHVGRGEHLGEVGKSGWAISPVLHWEYWRREDQGLRPTDPLFATLEPRLGQLLSVEQMEATSAPGPLDPIPGVQIFPSETAAPRAGLSGRHRRRRI